MIVWNSACQCLTVTIQCWKQWAEAFAETLISQFVPTADSIWPHLTQGPFVPKNPWNWPWLSYEPAFSLNVHICFATLPRSARGTEENSFGRKKLIYRVRKKNLAPEHFTPLLPSLKISLTSLSNQTFDATSSPCLLPCRRLFESCSETIEEFNPCFKTGWMLSKHFWTKMIWNLCVCHAISITHILQSAKSEIVNFRLK